MTSPLPTSRKAYRRTSVSTSNPKHTLVTEPLPPLGPTSVLIAIRAVSLNYRDANIAVGNNPWPVIARGIPCNDGAGSVIAVGSSVTMLKIGDRVAPNIDTENITGRETKRSWLSADEDGVLADYVVFDERVLSLLPEYLDWEEACTVPCAGVTAWMALKGVGIGGTVLIQGTGGVSLFALKLARAAGLRVILSSSSDDKLEKIAGQFSTPPISTVNYQNQNWHEEVLKLTNGVGVDVVVEVGGNGSIVQSVKCTRRGGIVSSVGYLSGNDTRELKELLPTLIDRRVNLRGINAGSKNDMDDLCAAISATEIRLSDIIDSIYPFEKANEAIEHIWQGKQIGKVVIRLA